MSNCFLICVKPFQNHWVYLNKLSVYFSSATYQKTFKKKERLYPSEHPQSLIQMGVGVGFSCFLGPVNAFEFRTDEQICTQRQN